MKKFGIKLYCKLLVLFSLPAVLVACGNPDGFSPRVGSPPPFDYADGEVLRSRMHQLAFASQQLDSALIGQDERGSATQTEVISALRNIERIASDLEEGDLSTTHRFLRNDMQTFLSNVNRALRDAERNPPSFYSAGRVSGSCVNCHRSVQ